MAVAPQSSHSEPVRVTLISPGPSLSVLACCGAVLKTRAGRIDPISIDLLAVNAAEADAFQVSLLLYQEVGHEPQDRLRKGQREAPRCVARGRGCQISFSVPNFSKLPSELL